MKRNPIERIFANLDYCGIEKQTYTPMATSQHVIDANAEWSN